MRKHFFVSISDKDFMGFYVQKHNDDKDKDDIPHNVF